MSKPIADKGETCPFWKKDVSKVCHKCPLYVMLRGTNKNTGADIDQWGCALAWGPIMAVEMVQTLNSAVAATEGFRGDMAKANQIALRLALSEPDDPSLIGVPAKTAGIGLQPKEQ